MPCALHRTLKLHHHPPVLQVSAWFEVLCYAEPTRTQAKRNSGSRILRATFKLEVYFFETGSQVSQADLEHAT